MIKLKLEHVVFNHDGKKFEEEYHMLLFRDEYGKKYITYAVPEFRNYKHWEPMLNEWPQPMEFEFHGSISPYGNVLNADSKPQNVRVAPWPSSEPSSSLFE